MNSLGGNSRTVLVCCISPSALNFDETLNTLRFADRASRVKVEVRRNIAIDYRALAGQLQAQLDLKDEELNQLRMKLSGSHSINEDDDKSQSKMIDRIMALEQALERADQRNHHYEREISRLLNQRETSPSNLIGDELIADDGIDWKKRALSLEEELKRADHELCNTTKALRETQSNVSKQLGVINAYNRLVSNATFGGLYYQEERLNITSISADEWASKLEENDDVLIGDDDVMVNDDVMFDKLFDCDHDDVSDLIDDVDMSEVSSEKIKSLLLQLYGKISNVSEDLKTLNVEVSNAKAAENSALMAVEQLTLQLSKMGNSRSENVGSSGKVSKFQGINALKNLSKN
ncbi:hypothetical protein GEMRC1_010143 [Eukaryota sp. GEM-RC1]